MLTERAFPWANPGLVRRVCDETWENVAGSIKNCCTLLIFVQSVPPESLAAAKARRHRAKKLLGKPAGVDEELGGDMVSR
jgi:hypothetical protein